MAVSKKSFKSKVENLSADQPLDMSKLIEGVESKPIIPMEEKPIVGVGRYDVPVEERFFFSRST